MRPHFPVGKQREAAQALLEISRLVAKLAFSLYTEKILNTDPKMSGNALMSHVEIYLTHILINQA